MENENNVQGIMNVTMEKLRAMADVDTIIGDPIVAGGVTLIPVSKVSFGLAAGGTDKNAQRFFGGGGGAGVTITPVAFIAVQNGEVRLLQISKEATAADKAVALVPELFDKISGLFKKDKQEQKSAPSDEAAGAR
ncbi:MAG: sporulation protein YtfJ [Clostridiales bacterium]|nr:sporulation protein YtfJ [Clostridiales bacterium]